MKSAWSDEDATHSIKHWKARYPSSCNEDVALRVYTSRLIGEETSLVLHGGGNTSVKTQLHDELGKTLDVLCVKGSGWDLSSIEPPGLPAVRLEPLRALRALSGLSDEAMVNAARTQLLDASAPNPSVEVLLHAFLPHKFIDHSHADAILSLVDQPNAAELCRDVFGDAFGVVPYIMPGFALAKLAAEIYESHPHVEGLLLLQHGLFTFGETAQQSYERHIRAVTRAEEWLQNHRQTQLSFVVNTSSQLDYANIAPLVRGELSRDGRRYILTLRQTDAVRAFVDHPHVADLALRGPATPDHVIRTKQFPLVLDIEKGIHDSNELSDFIRLRVDEYRRTYRAYFERQTSSKGVQRKSLDPDPRVLLIPGLGVIAVGSTLDAANVAADIYENTIDIITDAEGVGRYLALPEADIFDMEYWSLEQAKLGKAKARALESRAVYITGAASGIGRATARLFASAGAHLFLVDRDSALLEEVASELKCPFGVVDVQERVDVTASLRRAVEYYGGLDGVVSNAGIAPQGLIHECPPEAIEESLRINLLAHQWVAARATEIMRAQGLGGFLLFNASKAAFAPGPGFGPYAIAKAALVALMKQYALENGDYGIRSNAVNADRIRSSLLSADDIEARARAHGLSADQYYRTNLLRREVTAEDVAQAFLALALAESTTGATLTVDGGNIAASPR